jgi:hypothetical protein
MKATPEQLAGFKSAKTVEENMSDLSGRERGVVRSNYPPLEPN